MNYSLKLLNPWKLKALYMLLIAAFIVISPLATASSNQLDSSTRLSFSVANSEDIEPGGLAFVNVILTNPNVEYASFEFHLNFPTGWVAEKFSQADAGIGTKTIKSYCQIIPGGRLDETDEHTAKSVLCLPTYDSSLDFLASASSENEVIATGNDVVAMFAIRIPENANYGNYPIQVSGIYFSTGITGGVGDGDIDDFTFNVTIPLTNPVLATGISLNKTDLNLKAGNSETLTATIQPNNASYKTVSWQSSNTSVATVNQNGLVTANGSGSATITATTTDGTNLSASCIVNVDILATSITLNKSSSKLRVGESETLIATILPANATEKSITWNSSNTHIATVNSNGVVTALAPGATTISAHTIDGSDLSATCEYLITSIDLTTKLSFSVANTEELKPGSLAFVNIILTNPNVEYAGFQCDFNYPSGWISEKFSQKDAGIGPKTIKNYCQIIPGGRLDETEEQTAFSILGNTPNDASFRFVVYDTDLSGKKIPIGDDVVAMFAIRIPEDATPGDYSINANKIWFTTGDINLIGDGGIDPINFTITVGSQLMGDANGDGTVNVSDYVYVANYILEQNPEPFVFAAADIDGNGEINVSDLVLVANIALTYEDPNTLNAPAPKATLNTDIDMNATLHKNADGTTSITVDLNNSMDLTALQMDISLPQGMAVTGATLTDRATRSHQTEVAQLANGSYRLLAASSASKAFKGNEGALLTLTLSGEPQGTVTLGGIKLASPDGQCFTVNDMLLAPIVTGIDDITTQARIYGEAGSIVIESPVNGMAQLVLPNGMSRTVKVKSGRNIYPAPATGLVIVRAGEKAVKLIF